MRRRIKKAAYSPEWANSRLPGAYPRPAGEDSTGPGGRSVLGISLVFRCRGVRIRLYPRGRVRRLVRDVFCRR